MSSSPDSYSSLERKLLAPARGLLRVVYAPLVRALAALHVPPNGDVKKLHAGATKTFRAKLCWGKIALG